MGEHIFGGDATAWYEFDIGDVKVAEGMEVGIEFSDWGWIGDNARKRVYDLFTWKKINERTMEIYINIIQSSQKKVVNPFCK